MTCAFKVILNINKALKYKRVLLRDFKYYKKGLKADARIKTLNRDLGKAFDRVDHTILITKLAENKIKRNKRKWIREFL